MNTHTHSTKLIALLSLGLGAALVCANAAPGVGAGIGGGVHAGFGAPSVGFGASSGGTGFGASSGAGASGSAAANVGGAGAQLSTVPSSGISVAGVSDVNMDTSTYESMGMHQARISTPAQNAGGAAASAPGMTVANDHAVTAVLNTGPSPKMIASADVTERDHLVAQMKDQIRAGDHAMVSLKKQGKSLNGEDRAEFNAAVKDTAAKEKALKQSVKVAGKASAESWTSARAKVASDYSAYAQAMAHAEALSHPAASANTTAVSHTTATAKSGTNVQTQSSSRATATASGATSSVHGTADSEVAGFAKQ